MRDLNPKLLLEVSGQLGIGAQYIEKDARLAELLAAISTCDLPPGISIVFAGGTCLARAYQLTERMSEDVDIKIVLPADATKSAVRKRMSEFKASVRHAALSAGFEIIGERSRNDNRNVNFEVSFPSSVLASGILRPHILLETTVSTPRLATIDMPVRSFINAYTDESAEVPAIACVSLNEMAAEKFIALTRRIAGELEGTKAEVFDEALVRHIYDLNYITSQTDKGVVTDLVRQVMAQDAEQFASWYPAYAKDPVDRTVVALEALQSEPAYRGYFDKFQATMVYGPKLEYSAAIANLVELAAVVLDRSLMEASAFGYGRR